MNDKEREEGRAASRRTQGLETCPYDRRSRPGRAWTEGWKHGCAEMAVLMAKAKGGE